ncbi:MAG: hypothetical protein JSU72_02050 [Deltaproteobacteria bacterium]|nr:MAG: hypothetical protein JSU72_02050 [Deltaproteobacteria bacterium]
MAEEEKVKSILMGLKPPGPSIQYCIIPSGAWQIMAGGQLGEAPKFRTHSQSFRFSEYSKKAGLSKEKTAEPSRQQTLSNRRRHNPIRQGERAWRDGCS